MSSSIVLIKTIVINPFPHAIAIRPFVQDAEFLPARPIIRRRLIVCYSAIRNQSSLLRNVANFAENQSCELRRSAN